MEDLLEEIGKELTPPEALETYQTLAKIFGNILDNPSEAKFRNLKKDNKVISGKILRSNHAASLLLAIGFEDEEGMYRLPLDSDLDVLRTAHELLECLVLSSDAVAPETAVEPAGGAAECAEPAPEVTPTPARVAAAAAPAAASGQSAAIFQGLAKRRDDPRQGQMDQLQAARAAQKAQFVANPEGPTPVAAAVPVAASGYPTSGAAIDAAAAAKKNKPTDIRAFQNRGKKEEEKNRAAMTLEEIRREQKSKYKDFENDPNAKKQEAYKQPPSVAGGAKAEEGWGGWFGGMFGGGSSSTGSSSKPRQQPERRGPNIKGVADLPKPPPRAGG